MPVLFCISILALIALLWATIAIARHIHQARLRHHRELHHKPVQEAQFPEQHEANVTTKGRAQIEENDPR